MGWGWGASGRKKSSARVIDSNVPSHKTLSPASPWCVAHPDPTLSASELPPTPARGSTPQHVVVLEACVCLCVCRRSGESGVSPRKKKTPGIGRRCNGVRTRWLAIAGDPHARSLRPPPGLTASLIPRSVLPSHRAPELGRPVQLAAPEHSPLLSSPNSPPPAPRAGAQGATSPEPAPTSGGGAEKRAAGGGAVVPGGQLHAVGEDHPPSGGDGPARGLAAAAASGHGLPER